jgi:hypothetical protein
MNDFECIKNASLDTHKGTQTLLLTVQIIDEALKPKVLILLEMVPRVGIEPTRPYLTNPRILSPTQKGFFSNLRAGEAYFHKIMHQKCITGQSRTLLNLPFSLTNKKIKQHDHNSTPSEGESNGQDTFIRNYELQKIQSKNRSGKTLMV